MLAAACAATVGLATISTPAGAAAAVPEEVDAHLRAWWTTYDVPADVQGHLLAALSAGETWDSLAGAAPTSREVLQGKRSTTTVLTFADGSITVTEVQKPDRTPAASIRTVAVDGCRTTVGGSGYRNYYDCQAHADTGVIAMGFYISYTLAQGGPDQIIEVHSPYLATTGGTASPNPPTLAIRKKLQNSSGSAWANATTQFTGYGSGGSKSVDFRALVGNDTAWTRWEAKP
ncbi:hypothetical protein GXP71_01530 [Cellulomonas sp. H30R-01]|uniref:Uncharacterized protein n=1 Tax=Cellulomonas algicola TaxID=2071633 RepID=A0A401UVX2_9CELL|nr:MULTISPECIES: DUF5626 family protein [Cellulomonas]QHT54906.1 hypothetical protein GXP71_01530 [Cellulomonas sp. H30R-01]GCD18724.1 hypothetical protein CTKZ_02860 [Cellulomonas algicola]